MFIALKGSLLKQLLDTYWVSALHSYRVRWEGNTAGSVGEASSPVTRTHSSQ